jgi:excisionase family DNA binding protein
MKLEANDRLLDVWEVAEMLRRKPSTIRKDIHLRKIPTVRIGRQVRVPLSAIQALVATGYSPALVTTR